jgi:hypothetical protein
MKKLIIIGIIFTTTLISCGPSACDCVDVLTTEVNSGFKEQFRIQMSVGPNAADEYQSKVNDCADKFTELNEDIKKMDFANALEYKEKQRINALKVVKAKCD